MSTPEITTFTYLDKHPIRTVKIDGEPWLVVKDVMNVLGLTHPTNALRNCNPSTVQELRLPGQRGGRPNKLVNEAGFYKLVLRSNKPDAKPFQDWVAGTVLPTIRKTGSYVQGEEKFDVSTEEGLAAATQLVMGDFPLP